MVLLGVGHAVYDLLLTKIQSLRLRVPLRPAQIGNEDAGLDDVEADIIDGQLEKVLRRRE